MKFIGDFVMQTNLDLMQDKPKLCKCGKDQSVMPINAREWEEGGSILGWVWECECHSTMFKKNDLYDYHD